MEEAMEKEAKESLQTPSHQDIKDKALKGYPSAVTMLDRFCDEQHQHPGYELAKKLRAKPDAWTKDI